MNAVAIPVTILQAAAPGPALAALRPGMVMQGLVLGLAGDGLLRLQLPGGVFEVKAGQTLPAGTRVQVAVAGSTAQPKLVLTPLSAPGATGAGAAVRAPASLANASPPGTQPSSTATAPAQTSLQQVIQTVVAAAVREAIGKQGGVAPLMAELEAALVRAGDALPVPVRAAAAQVLAMRLDVRGNVDAGALRTALLASGLAGHARPDGGTPAPDLNTTLTQLRQSLMDWLGRDVVRLPPVPQAAPSPANAGTSAPLPPHRHMPTAPQPAVPASLAPQADAQDIGAHLLARTEAAIARQTLLQAASLPDPAPGEAGKPDAAASRIVLDVPLLAAQGHAAAQIRIEKDGGHRGRAADDARPAWRANFSVDLEPIGPVHARVTIVGDTAHVALLAERGDSAAALRDNIALLQAGLAGAAIEPGDIRCAAGAPAAPAAAPGLFVDRAS